MKNLEVDGNKIKLQIWDTAGQERFRTITTSYYRGAQGIAIVYDVTDRESFEHIKFWMADIDRFARENVLRFLVGNKCDLEDQRKIAYQEGLELAERFNIPFIETSAKDKLNIDDLFMLTVRTYLKRIDINSKNTNNHPIQKKKSMILEINKTEEDDKDNCCLK